MQRRSALRTARRNQIASEYRRYGIHPMATSVRVSLVPRPASDAPECILPFTVRSSRLMADGLPAWAARITLANERSIMYHADRS